MTKEEQLLVKHFIDLANSADQKYMPVSTDFLTLYEQDLFLSLKEKLPPVYCKLNGGASFAERKMILFLPDKELFKDYHPIQVLKITPVLAKFADELTHRDYLGALMNLGIERGTIGDIMMSKQASAYLFCKDHMADFICNELRFIKHTNVSVSICQEEVEMLAPKMEEIIGSVASVRLDSVLSQAFHGSRSKLTELIEGKKVFVNSKLVESGSYVLKENDVVSVRGMGKFIFKETTGISKKGRTYIKIHKYI